MEMGPFGPSLGGPKRTRCFCIKTHAAVPSPSHSRSHSKPPRTVFPFLAFLLLVSEISSPWRRGTVRPYTGSTATPSATYGSLPLPPTPARRPPTPGADRWSSSWAPRFSAPIGPTLLSARKTLVARGPIYVFLSLLGFHVSSIKTLLSFCRNPIADIVNFFRVNWTQTAPRIPSGITF